MKTFDERFGGEPSVRASAHGRVNLLGEHTDYNDGLVLPTAIPQQTWVSMRARPAQPSIVYSADLDQESELVPGHAPQAQFARYIYGCMAELEARCGALPALEIHVDSSVPIGVGLSSSAALEIATLRALRVLLGLDLDDVALAQIGQSAEVAHAGVNCGILDQMASSLLVPGQMLYLDTRSLERSLLPLPAEAELLVLDSGLARSLADSKYNERRAECEQAARLLGVPSLRDAADLARASALPDPFGRRARHVISENARVSQARGASASALGELMNASHSSLSRDYEVSTAALDLLVDLLQAEDCVHGAKLTGAGFGGACVALCRPGSATRCADHVLAAYQASGQRGRVLVPVR